MFSTSITDVVLKSNRIKGLLKVLRSDQDKVGQR